MALINTLRKRMGKIVVGVVAFSMFAFILTDLLNSNSVLFGVTTDVGTIDGTTISNQNFQDKVNEFSTNFALNNGRNPLSEEIDEIQQQVWQSFIFDVIFEKEFDKVGVDVTDAELVDMVQGTNIHPQIRQFFTDPNTGQFSKQSVTTFLQQLSSAPPAQQASWLSFERTLAPGRKLAKYEGLIERTRFANKFEAEREYRETASRSIAYLYVPYFSVSDTLVEITDEDLKSYLDSHRKEYQQEQTKDISFVQFDIKPSGEDSLLVLEEVTELVEALQSAPDDSVFASINSDGLSPYATYKPNNFPRILEGDDVVLEVGYVSEPQQVNGNYTFFKISDIYEGDEAFVKASHILFKADDESKASKASAKAEARRVLREIRNGADFGVMAAQYGTDGTSSRGGDLGWFGENSAFAQEFKDASFGHRGTGLLGDVVETDFGFHIIKIDEAKSNKVYKIATIEKSLFTSDRTLNEIYRQADIFASEVTSDNFFSRAEELGIDVRTANGIQKNGKRVANMVNARSIVFWLFNTAEIGSVSEVFELDDTYVIAIQTGEQEAGDADLASVRPQVSRRVYDQKKEEYIINRLQGLEGAYDDIRTTYGDGARVGTGDITLGSNSFPGVGFAPKAIGTAFSLDEGEATLPFGDTNGVLMITVTEVPDQPKLADYEAYRGVVLNAAPMIRRREEPFSLQSVYNSLIKSTDIEDQRYKFY